MFDVAYEAEVVSMLDRLRCIDIAIGTCNFWLQKAEDSKNVDSFNYWFGERERYFRERAELLNVKLGGV